MREILRDVGFAENLGSPFRISALQEQLCQRNGCDAVPRLRLANGLTDGQRTIAPPVSHEKPYDRQQKLSFLFAHFFGGLSRNTVTMIFSY